MQRRFSKQVRRGASLIEMVIYISLIGVIFPLAAVALAKAIQAADDVRQHSESASSLERLARQFREDVREAKTATVEQEGKQLVLAMPDERSILYQSSATAFDRTVPQGTATQGRDTYAFSNLAPTGVELGSDGAEAALVFRVIPGGQSSADAAGRTLRVQAGVGRNHRFQPQ